jgi:hypothetical protein
MERLEEARKATNEVRVVVRGCNALEDCVRRTDHM